MDRTLEQAQFGCLAFVVLAAPWLFGAWEMWWFWPFTVVLFGATALFALRVLLAPSLPWSTGVDAPPAPRARRLLPAFFAGYLVFLGYAGVRFLQADVFMDAERGFLLFLTPLLIGVQVVYGLRPVQKRRLFVALLVNIALFGLYGVVNHAVTGSERVLWAPGFPQYFQEGRASGAYYCPDHFSGMMELGLCMGLALVMDRRTRAGWRTGGALISILGVICVGMSKSRGGGLTVLVIGLAALVWGFRQWPAAVRWYLRGATVLVGLAALVVVWTSDLAYVTRFKSYFGMEQMQGLSLTEQRAKLARRLTVTSRGRMIGGALRAWQSQPLLGIGPGMHQNLWPRFAATRDGDREMGVWPTQSNHTFHSYEVHSDWVQLLEEYGVIGLLLFLLPATLFFRLLVVVCPDDESIERRPAGRMPLAAAPLSALLAFAAMAFHSLGDFNLQIPATTWVLAALLALPFTNNEVTNNE